MRKKYDLPDFSLLDSEFEISSIEDDKFPLREIRKKITEKIDLFNKLLEEAIQPETNLVCMHECKAFSEEEKAEIYETFKKMMAFQRSSVLAYLANDEKSYAEFIKSFMKEWPSIKKDLSKFLQKLRDSWSEEKELKEDLEYMG